MVAHQALYSRVDKLAFRVFFPSVINAVVVQKRTEPKSRDISSRIQAKASERELFKRIMHMFWLIDWGYHKGYISTVYSFSGLVHSCFILTCTPLCFDRARLPLTYLLLETLRLFLLLILGSDL